MHLAIYRARPDVTAIVHTHPPTIGVIGAGLDEIPFMFPDQVALVGTMPCIDYVVPCSPEPADAVVTAMQDHGVNALLMQNHGLITIGHTLKEAYFRTEVIGDAARVYWIAASMGTCAHLSAAVAAEIPNLEAERYRQRLLRDAANPILIDMISTRPALLGVDVGTQGIRVVAVDPTGELLSSHHTAFPLQKRGVLMSNHPRMVGCAYPASPGRLIDLQAADKRVQPLALSVTSTSGTVIPLAADHTPIHSALMYDDKRAVSPGRALSGRLRRRGSDRVAVWTVLRTAKDHMVCRVSPPWANRIASWCHAADFLIGRLSGVWGVTDPTNALKTGYDPELGYLADLHHRRTRHPSSLASQGRSRPGPLLVRSAGHCGRYRIAVHDGGDDGHD